MEKVKVDSYQLTEVISVLVQNGYSQAANTLIDYATTDYVFLYRGKYLIGVDTVEVNVSKDAMQLITSELAMYCA